MDSHRRFQGEHGRRLSQWRPSVPAHRKPVNRAVRHPRVWSYTNRSPFDYEVHRLLFGMTVYWITEGRL
ncbi:hypothetical protein [Fimbriimonas ginsengisoli]|uniref:Uncharacterized protein n=1 Tax=Fimbriimonas ginsengisoli Gsoil 348 TaxID=661478 RepID=A0A068NRI1_FIMGI|nr:hypothetical protein [Fimbriimonas ginsengisoli]AIE85375.1 hypothetical protein OP10G_2007 [Fimbriimonas ginsengisoli Gsoil 348]